MQDGMNIAIVYCYVLCVNNHTGVSARPFTGTNYMKLHWGFKA